LRRPNKKKGGVALVSLLWGCLRVRSAPQTGAPVRCVAWEFTTPEQARALLSSIAVVVKETSAAGSARCEFG